MSPQKVRLVTRLLRGMDFKVAERELMFLKKGIAPEVLCLLRSAAANAENNFGLDKDNLFVKELTVGAGPVFKRWRARSRGMASQIRKPTSHITIVLAEKVPGKKKVKKPTAAASTKVVKLKSKSEISDLMKAESAASAATDKKGAASKTGFFQKKSDTDKSRGGGKGIGGAVGKFFRRKSEG